MSDNWVWETNVTGVSFEPIWPGRYSHLLWSGVPRVLLLSATLWPYTLQLLGLSRDQYEYREFSNGWPPNRGVVYYWPTVKLNVRSTESDYALIAHRIDEIIAARSDRKGIIHSVSYNRMRKLLAHSRYTRIMHYNETASGALDAAQKFRSSNPPAVLVSPSFGTGWDFAYDQCEYQIIPKIPFPYAESRVMRERVKDDQYRVYSAALEMTQMIGRGRRAHDDRCETFILDKNLPLVTATGKRFLGKAFTTYRISALPKRPEKIIREKLIGSIDEVKVNR